MDRQGRIEGHRVVVPFVADDVSFRGARAADLLAANLPVAPPACAARNLGLQKTPRAASAFGRANAGSPFAASERSSKSNLMNLHGKSIIAGTPAAGAGETFAATNPATGERLPVEFHKATDADVNAALAAPETAFAE